MYKVIALVSLLMATPALSETRTLEDCITVRDGIIIPVAEARDKGTPPELVFQQLLMVGVPPQLANQFVNVVYFMKSDLTPEEVGEDYMDWCVQDKGV